MSSESLRTRLERLAFNLFPAYRGSGGRIRHISADWRTVRVEIPLGWRTRNYVGTIYGGSLYGAIDPIYMIMLMRNLPRGYVVWDKAATIRFRRPGRTTLTAEFSLSEEELAEIHAALRTAEKLDRTYLVELKDRDGVVHAAIEKTLHIRRPG